MASSQDTTPAKGQSWNADAYAQSGRFVANLATGVFELLAAQPGEYILDLGCGDGALTEKIAATGAVVLGVDVSDGMLAGARALGLNIQKMSGDALTFSSEFDAVFSNAALHWMSNAEAVIAGVYRSLKTGGRFVAEMGGMGNIAAIRVALQTVLAPFGIDSEASADSFYPSAAHYRRLLEVGGFAVDYIEIIPRPTPLPKGEPTPMHVWLNTFRNGVLDRLAPDDRAFALEETVALLKPALCDVDGNWTADYVRLRFKAVKI